MYRTASPAGHDLAGQVERAYLNLHATLRAAGIGFDDITELTVSVADLTRDEVALVKEGIGRAAADTGLSLLTPAAIVSGTSSSDRRITVAASANAKHYFCQEN